MEEKQTGTKVTFKSNEGQLFSFETREKSRDKAIEKAEEKLTELNYDHYGYNLYSVQDLKN